MTTPDHPDRKRDDVPEPACRTEDTGSREKAQQQKLRLVKKLLKVPQNEESRGDEYREKEEHVRARDYANGSEKHRCPWTRAHQYNLPLSSLLSNLAVHTITDMNAGEADILKTRTRPAYPIRPTLPPHLHHLLHHELPRRPEAVLLDVYGTLFISASGDVGTALDHTRVEHFASAYRDATGVDLEQTTAEELRRRFFEVLTSERERISAAHRHEPRFVPEVDIRAIWTEVLSIANFPGSADPNYLSLCYEAHANPVWPMPGARSLFWSLSTLPLQTGLASNAQYFTLLLPEVFWGVNWTEIGCRSELCAFSFQIGRAKPDPELFAGPLASLRAQGIDSERVVYVGNDMKNDIATAAACGCMTVLFAGDSRSLRLRPELNLSLNAIDSIIVSLDELPVICRPRRTFL